MMGLLRQYSKWCVLIPVLLWSASCAVKQEDHFGSREISFAELKGWDAEDHVQALEVFVATCGILAREAKPASTGSGLQVSEAVWISLCNDANLARGNGARARYYFEQHFTPFRVTNNGREEGLFTGYYEPVLYGSKKRGGDFVYPVYAPPAGLEKKLPYFSRDEIDRGKLSGRKLELAWVDDPVMLFFLHIQGSGRIKLPSGKEMRIGYAGKNGQAYVGLGKIMGEENLLPKDQINFFTIRQWLYDHKKQAFAMMARNPSYVFFKENTGAGPLGAVGAPLTPQRSLAVDSRYIPYGLPLYLETQLPPWPNSEPQPFTRIMVAQDTGGAIKGPVRGDVFFGAGDDAEYMAGYMKGRGVYTLLVPRDLAYQLR